MKKVNFEFKISAAESLLEIEQAIDFVVEHQMQRYNISTTKREIIDEDIGREVYWFTSQRSNQIIGVVAAKIWPEKRHHVSVHYWVVKDTERGSGVGRALLEKVCDVARNRNEKYVFAASRPAAVAAYEACGFTRLANMDEIPYKGMMLVPYERIV